MTDEATQEAKIERKRHIEEMEAYFYNKDAPKWKKEDIAGVGPYIKDVDAFFNSAPASTPQKRYEHLEFKPIRVKGRVRRTKTPTMPDQAFVCGRKNVMQAGGCSADQFPIMVWGTSDKSRAFKASHFNTPQFDACCADKEMASSMYDRMLGVHDALQNKYGDTPDLVIEDLEESFFYERSECRRIGQEFAGAMATVIRMWAKTQRNRDRLNKADRDEGERLFALFMHVVVTAAREIDIVIRTESYDDAVVLGTACIIPGTMGDVIRDLPHSGKLAHYMKGEVYGRAQQVVGFLQHHMDSFDPTGFSERYLKEYRFMSKGVAAWYESGANWIESQGFLVMLLGASFALLGTALMTNTETLNGMITMFSTLDDLIKGTGNTVVHVMVGILLTVLVEKMHERGKNLSDFEKLLKQGVQGMTHVKHVNETVTSSHWVAALNGLKAMGENVTNISMTRLSGGSAIATALYNASNDARQHKNQGMQEMGMAGLGVGLTIAPSVFENAKEFGLFGSTMLKTALLSLNIVSVSAIGRAISNPDSVAGAAARMESDYWKRFAKWLWEPLTKEGKVDALNKANPSYGAMEFMNDVRGRIIEFFGKENPTIHGILDTWLSTTGALLVTMVLVFYACTAKRPNNFASSHAQTLLRDIDTWAKVRNPHFFEKNGHVFLPEVNTDVVAQVRPAVVPLAEEMNKIRDNACTPHTEFATHSLCS